MATQTENVVVNLKVNADGSLEQATEAIEKQAKTVNILNANFTGLNVTLGKVAASFMTLRSGSVILAGSVLKGNVAFASFTSSLFVVEKTIARRVLPVLIRLAPALAAVTAAVLAVVVAIKSWDEASKSTIEGQERLAVSADFARRNWESWIITLSSATDAVGRWNESIRDSIIINQQWFGFLSRNLILAKLTVQAANEAAAAYDKQAASLVVLTNDLQTINNLLENDTLSDERRIDLLGDRFLKEEEIAKLRIDTLERERGALITANIGRKEADEDRIAREQRIKEIENEQLQLQNDINQARFVAAQAITEVLTKEEKVTEEKKKQKEFERDPLEEEELRDVGDPFDGFFGDPEGTLEFLKKINKQVVDDIKDRNEDIEDLEEETTDFMDKEAEKRARARIAWDEFGTSNQLSLLGNFFDSASQLAGENFEAQKSFAIAAAVIHTAAGVARAFEDYQWPVSILVGAAVAAAGAAQVSQIANTQPGEQGTSSVNAVVTTSATPSSLFENTTGSFRTTNELNENSNQKQQVVLVTEDLNAVQNRTRVTEQRSSL
jgi:hypothetical protein